MPETQITQADHQREQEQQRHHPVIPVPRRDVQEWLASPFQKTRFPWPALRKKSTCQHLKIGRSPVKTGLLASTESLRVRHPVPRPAGKGPRGARTAPRFASCSASLAKRVPSESNNLQRHELPSGSATGALQGQEDHAEPESRDWNGGDGPRGDQQERTRSLRTARSAHFPGRAVPVRSRAAGWGPPKPIPNASDSLWPQHRGARLFNLRGRAGSPPSGSDVSAALPRRLLLPGCPPPRRRPWAAAPRLGVVLPAGKLPGGLKGREELG